MALQGIGAAGGYALGIAKVILPAVRTGEKQYIDADQAREELERLQKAISRSAAEIGRIASDLTAKGLRDEAEIMEGHLLLLEDDELVGRARELIAVEHLDATWAMTAAMGEVVAVLEGLDDPYLRERTADIRDVSQRIINNLNGGTEETLSAGDEKIILIAEELTPSQTAQLDPEVVGGFVTKVGGKTSHSAIMARSLGVPAVSGIGELLASIPDGQVVAIDGNEGKVYVNPDRELVTRFRSLIRNNDAHNERFQSFFGKKTVSADGKQVELVSNIGSYPDAQTAKKNGAEGVGLFRTEFLYMGRDTLPTEEEQLRSYAEVVNEFGAEAPIVIRTMDIGGDKELPLLNLAKEDNPFLGYRAIRICLDEPELFKTQLRAILRASVLGNVKIMFPMVATLAEWRKASDLLLEAKEELDRQGGKYSPDVETGIMIEIPAAALLADQFAKEVDFFSIGTNDLVQYTMAADRMNEKVSHLNDALNPSVLRLIQGVIRAAHENGKWVGMCGEMAGQPHAVPILLGMGLNEFSMNSRSVLRTRALISGLKQEQMKELAAAVVQMGDAEEIKKYVERQVPVILDYV